MCILIVLYTCKQQGFHRYFSQSSTNYIEPAEHAKLIATKLQEQRTMLGLHQAPSKDLIDAEVKLAEVSACVVCVLPKVIIFLLSQKGAA